MNANGLTAVVAATGMGKVHTTEEFIAVSELEKTARLALELMIG